MSGREIWVRVLVAPVTLIALAALLRSSGIDYRITDFYFDAAAQVFPQRADAVLELIGHSLAKDFALLTWFCLVAAALASVGVDELRPYRKVLWLTIAAMALGPVMVVILKEYTALPCPWNLKRYGGLVAEQRHWFVRRADAGRCFPAGHSAGGFSFFAFYFAALAMRRQRLAHVALSVALTAGCVFSLVRVVQGAHFVSHALWSAAIDWLMAALVFIPAMSGKLSLTTGRHEEQGERVSR